MKRQPCRCKRCKYLHTEVYDEPCSECKQIHKNKMDFKFEAKNGKTYQDR